MFFHHEQIFIFKGTLKGYVSKYVKTKKGFLTKQALVRDITSFTQNYIGACVPIRIQQRRRPEPAGVYFDLQDHFLCQCNHFLAVTLIYYVYSNLYYAEMNKKHR